MIFLSSISAVSAADGPLSTVIDQQTDITENISLEGQSDPNITYGPSTAAKISEFLKKLKNMMIGRCNLEEEKSTIT